MVVRVVKIVCKQGMEEELRQLGRNDLVSINKDAGCIDIYFLEPTKDNPYFGAVGIWENEKKLNEMKTSDRYLQFREKLAKVIESLTDELFTVKE